MGLYFSNMIVGHEDNKASQMNLPSIYAQYDQCSPASGGGGVMVTYGGMSRKPVSVATSHLIFKQIQLRGFWMGQWNEKQGRSEAR